jgi:hypothetical protein
MRMSDIMSTNFLGKMSDEDLPQPLRLKLKIPYCSYKGTVLFVYDHHARQSSTQAFQAQAFRA